MSKKHPKEIIEKRTKKDGKDREYMFLKIGGRKLIELPVHKVEGQKYRIKADEKKLNKILKKYKPKKYSYLHTHPKLYDSDFNLTASPTDLKEFLTNPHYPSMIVASLNQKNEVMGYFFLKKTKRTPDLKKFEGSIQNISSKFDEIHDAEEYANQFKKLAKEYHLNYRFIPTENMEYNEKEFIRRKNLEKILLITPIFLFLVSFILFSSNITGFSIANLTQKTLNLIGIIFFIIGIISAYFWFKNR